uniref:Uncharacterized protein n=1 Tax=Junco hyemalis TaxID=40217 RepID=A0A8C5J3I5_JUNHY
KLLSHDFYQLIFVLLVCTSAHALGQWFTLPMAEAAWGRKRKTLALPAACPGSQCGQRECPDISSLGSRALGQFVPVLCHPAPG